MKKNKIFVLSFAIFLSGLMVACFGSNYQTANHSENSASFQTYDSTILHDPIEDNPKYKKIFETIDAEVNEKLTDHPMRGGMGFCHIFWETKKEILKERYGIIWKSPAEMNPHIMFD